MHHCFQCRNEEWFYKLSGLSEDEVFRRLIEDGDELNPNQSKAIQREEHKDGMELMSPIATNRQAFGRWFVIFAINCYESNLIIIIF